MDHSWHGMIAGHGADIHNGRSYRIRVTKIGCVITRSIDTQNLPNYLEKVISGMRW